MTTSKLPNLTSPMNKGFNETDTSPIIHSIRWRHLPSKYTFKNVLDVINYHEKGPLIIDIRYHVVSCLDVYFLNNESISKVNVYLRFIKTSTGQLIEEPYTVGEGGRPMTLEPDPTNSNLAVLKGIAFTQNDLGDGTPLYDFMSMAREGVYEVWVKVTTVDGKELHLRVPFQWANLVHGSDGGGQGSDRGKESKVEYNNYDEYYVTVLDGDSPFTKRPTTHFRMAGVGILKNPFCYRRESISKPPSIDNPFNKVVPIIGFDSPATCELAVTPDNVNIKVGESVYFELFHKNTSDVIDIHVEYDPTMLKRLNEFEFESLQEGVSTVEFIVIYADGQECSVNVIVTSEEESSNVVSCGDTVQGMSGYGVFYHDVNEDGIYYIQYHFQGLPDRMYVFIGDTLIHDTGEVTNEEGSPFGFRYKPSDGVLKIQMNDGEGTGSQWSYTLYCPSDVPEDVKNNAIIVN